MRTRSTVPAAIVAILSLAICGGLVGCDAFTHEAPAPDPVVVQPQPLPGAVAPAPTAPVATPVSDADVLEAADAIASSRAAVAQLVGTLPPDDPRVPVLRQWVRSLDSASAAIESVPPAASATGPPGDGVSISGAAAPLLPFLGVYAPIGAAALGIAGAIERNWRLSRERQAKAAEQERAGRILRGVRNVVASVDSMRKNLVMNAEPANAQAIDQLVKTSLAEAQTPEGTELVKWAKGAAPTV